jgi:hypothetical protein
LVSAADEVLTSSADLNVVKENKLFRHNIFRICYN